MIDGEAVLIQVRQGTYMPDWQIFYGRPGFFFGEGLFYIGLGIIGILLTTIGAIATFLLFFIIPVKDATTVIIIPIVTLVALYVAILSFQKSIPLLKQIPTARQQVLILLPAGIVICENSSLQPTRVIQYKDTSRIELRVWQTGGKYRIMHTAVAIQQKNGGRSVWEIDGRFGSPGLIAQSIIADQARFAALHDIVSS